MKKIILFCAAVILFSSVAPVLAQQPFCNGKECTYTPLERIPGQQSGGITSVKDFGNYISSAFRIFIILGGMFAVATFVFGGVTYMTSETLGGKDWARQRMQRAVYGILLLLGSYLLLTTINPDFKFSTFDPRAISNQGARQQQQEAVQRGATQTDINDCQSINKRIHATQTSWECI